MDANKIGFQVQGVAPDLIKAFRANPRSIKLMDPGWRVDTARTIREVSPESIIVLRHTKGDQDYFKDPHIYADEATRVFAQYLNAGYVDYVESLNEPALNESNPNEAFKRAKRLNEWQVGYSHLMHERGYKVGAYCFSVGVPKCRALDGDGTKWSLLTDGVRASDALFLHEYGAPRMRDGVGALALHYRHVYDELSALGIRPVIGITETGIMRDAEAIKRHWCLEFADYSLLHLDCLPPSPLKGQSLPVKTIGDACRQQGQALIQQLLLYTHELIQQGHDLATIFAHLFAKQGVIVTTG